MKTSSDRRTKHDGAESPSSGSKVSEEAEGYIEKKYKKNAESTNEIVEADNENAAVEANNENVVVEANNKNDVVENDDKNGAVEVDISDSVQTDENAPDLVCPKCGNKLLLRVAKKGANAGKRFYGCSAFPKCRYIKNVN